MTAEFTHLYLLRDRHDQIELYCKERTYLGHTANRYGFSQNVSLKIYLQGNTKISNDSVIKELTKTRTFLCQLSVSLNSYVQMRSE